MTAYQEIQASEEFQDLRKRFRAFVFPMTAGFLIWYFLYVLTVTFLPEFMSIRVVGNINLGLIFGLLQFVTTFAITMAYVRWADKVFDPRADALAAKFAEGDSSK
nr:DUF485 domain-containing protein [Kineosphaera limosa]